MKQSIASVFAAVAFLAASAFADVTEGTDYTIDNTTCTVSIMTANGLQNVGQIDVSGCTGAPTYTLANDIAVNATGALDNTCTTNWDNTNAVFPAGSTFDGDGHTISGVCINDDANANVFLFDVKAVTKIQNLTFENVYINNTNTDSYGSTSILKGEATQANAQSITLDNVDFSSVTINANGYASLAFNKITNSVLFDKVDATDISITSGNEAGGFIGYIEGYTSTTVSFTSTTFDGSVTSTGYDAGGFIGKSYPLFLNIKNSSFNGSINAARAAGGLIAYVVGMSNHRVIEFEGNTIKANITSTGSNVGGFIGYFEIQSNNAATLFSNSSFTGTLSGVDYVGGIFGQTIGNSSDISTIENITIASENGITGSLIEATGNNIGGVAGYFNNGVELSKVSVKGKIATTSTNNYVGGLYGYSNHVSTFENAYFIGSIDASNYYAFGYSSYSSLKNSYVINLAGTGSEDLFPSYGSEKTGIVGYGTSLTAEASLYDGGEFVKTVKPNIPEFAWTLGMRYNPGTNNNLPYNAVSGPMFRIYGDDDGTRLFEFYTNADGRIAFDADGRSVSTLPAISYPTGWSDNNKPSLSKIYSSDTYYSLDFDINGCEIKIATARGLQNLTTIPGDFSSCANITYTLAKDIELSSGTPTTGCTSNWDNTNAVLPAKAIFNGAGHTISGVCLNNGSSEINTRLFKLLGSAEIKNVNFSKIYLGNTDVSSSTQKIRTALFSMDIPATSTEALADRSLTFSNVNLDYVSVHSNGSASYAALLIDSVAAATLSMENIKATNASIVAESSPTVTASSGLFYNHIIGGLVGAAPATTIKDVSYQGSISAETYGSNIGGLISNVNGNLNIDNGSFTGSISQTKNLNFTGYGVTPYVGGLIAYTQNSVISVKNSNVKAALSASAATSSLVSPATIGGLFGSIYNVSNIQITGSSYTGKIKATINQASFFLGGIIGYDGAQSAITLTDVHAKSTETSATDNIIEALATTVSSGTSYAAGLIGSAIQGSLNVSKSDVVGSINVTDGSSESYAAGLFGLVAHSVDVSESFFNGKITYYNPNKGANLYIGGIIGRLYQNDADAVTLSDVKATGVGTPLTLIDSYDKNATSYTHQHYYGGIIGNSGQKISSANNVHTKGNLNVSVDPRNTTTEEYVSVGGLFGYVLRDVESLTDASFIGNITVENNNTDIDGYSRIGGVLGGVAGAFNAQSLTIHDQENNASNTLIGVTAKKGGVQVGGILGYSESNSFSIDDATVAGVITHSQSDTANAKIGGILGHWYLTTGGKTGSITNVSYTGRLDYTSSKNSPQSAHLGGIVGQAYSTGSSAKLTITDALVYNDKKTITDNIVNFNVGSAKSFHVAGGIIGGARVINPFNISNSSVFGSFNCKSSVYGDTIVAGGILGRELRSSTGTFKNVSYVGNTTYSGYLNSTYLKLATVYNGDSYTAIKVQDSYTLDLSRYMTKAVYSNSYLDNVAVITSASTSPEMATVYKNNTIDGFIFPAKGPNLAHALPGFYYDPSQNADYPTASSTETRTNYQISWETTKNGVSQDIAYAYTGASGKIAYNADGTPITASTITETHTVGDQITDTQGLIETTTDYPNGWEMDLSKVYSEDVAYTENIVRKALLVENDHYSLSGCTVHLLKKEALMYVSGIELPSTCTSPTYLVEDDFDYGGTNSEGCTDNWDNEFAKFRGTLDGDGHTISGICLNNDDQRLYLFSTTGPAKIKNLTFSNINLQTNAYEAWISLFETNNGTYDAKEAVDFDHINLENITLKGSDVFRAGLLVQDARDHYLTLNEVHANNISIDFQSGNGYSNIGGFASYCGYPIQITNTSFKGKISAQGNNLGGFIADIGSYSDSSLIVNSSFEGKIDGNNSLHFGGFAGNGNGKIIFDKDTVKATITRSNSSAYVGGFIGYASSATTYVRNSLFIGNINLDNGANMVGSFVAYGSAKLDNAHARTPDGKPSSILIRVNNPNNTVYMGGLTGKDPSGNGSIKNSSFTGSIEATSSSYVGGLAGYAYNDSLISSTFNGIIKISSPTNGSYIYAGGAYGYAEGYFIQDVSINGIEVDGDTTCIAINAPISTTNQSYIGGLIGDAQDYDESFDIEDSKVNGNIQILASSGFYVGGLLGKSNESSIRNSTYNGSIKITKAESSKSGICAGGAIGSTSLGYGAAPNIISSTLSGVSVKGGKINNETVLLQIEDPFADNDVGSGVSNSIGGLIGHAAGTDSIVATKVYGNIVTNSSFAKYVEIGGLLGFSQNKKEISDYSFIGQIKAKHAQKEGYAAVGGLIGRMYTPTPGAIHITDSRATNAENSSNAPFISVSSKFENTFVGGIYGQVNTQQTAENVAVIGKINVDASSDVYLAGLVGNNYAEQGSITASYYIGSLTTNSSNKHVYGLTNDEKGGINLKHDYAIDFSGTATEPSNIKGAFIGLGTKPDADASVYIGTTKIGAAKPQSEQFASLLRAFEYKPDVNEGYPVPAPIKNNSFVWIDDGKIIANIQVENGKAYFNNGTPVNSRTIAKLPKMTTTTISKDSIKFVYWSSTVGGVKTNDPMILWDTDSLSNIIQSLSGPDVIAFVKDSFTIAKPKFVLKSDDEHNPITPSSFGLMWNGENYVFHQDSTFPVAGLPNDYGDRFYKNTSWMLKFNGVDNTEDLYANNLQELLKTLLDAINIRNVNKKDLKFDLILPKWYNGNPEIGFENITMVIRMANLQNQDLLLTIPELGKEITFPITETFDGTEVYMPRASKIKFNNNSDMIAHYETYSNSNWQEIKIPATGTLNIPSDMANMGIYPDFNYAIEIDTAGIGSMYDAMVAFDIPTTYNFDNPAELEFPAMASTKACFDGWEVVYETLDNGALMAPSAKSMNKAPNMPEDLKTNIEYLSQENRASDNLLVYKWYPSGAVYGKIKITPQFDETPCNYTLYLKYIGPDSGNDEVDSSPSDLKWSVSHGSRNFEVTKEEDEIYHKVTLPKTEGMIYHVEAKSATPLYLESRNSYNGYIISDNNFYAHPYLEYVIAHKLSDMDKANNMVTWADENGNILYKYLNTGDALYDVSDGSFKSVNKDILSQLPPITYRKNGKAYYFIRTDNEVWTGKYVSGNYRAKEIDFLDKAKFYVTDGLAAASLNEVNTTWTNVFVESFDLTVDSLPTVAAIFQNAPNNDVNQYYYATNTWSFVNGQTTSSASMASVDEFLDSLVTSKTKSGEIHLYVNFGSSNAYHDATEQMSIPACTEYGCQLRNFNTTIKSNSDVKFSAEVFGQNYEFVASANTNIPKIEKLRFVNARTDSLVILQSNENEELIDYDIVASNDEYKLPSLSSELVLTLKVQEFEENKLNTEIPQTSGMIFRQTSTPERYIDGIPVILPKLGALGMCFDGYEKLDENREVDEFVDLWPNDDGNFVLYTYSNFGEITVRAVSSSEECKVDTNRVTIKADSSAKVTVTMTHFGDTLKTEKGAYLLPAGGSWPVVINAIAKAPTLLDSLYFNDKLIKIGDTVEVSENSVIRLFTTDTTPEVDTTEIYRIAEARVRLSGTAMRFSVTTKDFKVKKPVSLAVRVYKDYEMIIDTVLTDSAENGTYNFDYYPLEPGKYTGEAILDGANGTVTAESNDWEISEERNVVVAGSWSMKSLANVTDDFEIPDDAKGAVYYWDEENALGDYMQYRKVRDIDSLKPTIGYWLVTDEPVDLKRKEELPTEDTLVWNLKNEFSGWNMVANPYPWSIGLDSIDFVDPQDTSDGFWRWNAVTMSYEHTNSVGPYEGLWVHTSENRDVKLANRPFFEGFESEDDSLATANAAEKKAAAKSKFTSGTWALRLTLNGENGLSDSWNVVGVGSREFEIEEPPTAMEGGVSLAIENGNRALAKSIKKSVDEASWNIAFSAASLQQGKFTVENLESLEQMGLHASLTMNGNVIPLKAGEPVNLMLSNTAKVAVLKVSTKPAIAVAGGINGLRFGNVGNKFAVSFELGEGYGKNVEVHLVATNGSVVSKASEKSTAGSHKVMLDKPASSGVYVLRISVGKDAKQVLVKF